MKFEKLDFEKAITERELTINLDDKNLTLAVENQSTTELEEINRLKLALAMAYGLQGLLDFMKK